MTIEQPIAAPPPGVLLGTSVLMQTIRRQPDPDRAASFIGKKINREIVVFRHQSATMDTADVAVAMHKRVDRHIADHALRDPSTEADVQCARSCTACCYQNVSLSEPEARLAFEAAYKAGHEIDEPRLRKQAEHDMQSYQDALTKDERRCVMLKDDGDCAIYADRPTACRTYRVISPPANCDTETNAHGIVMSWTTPLAEAVVSAAMRSFRYGSLASFLLEFGWPDEPMHPSLDHHPQGAEA